MKDSMCLFVLFVAFSVLIGCSKQETKNQWPLGQHKKENLTFFDKKKSVQINVTKRIFKMKDFNFRTHPIVVSRNGRNFAYGALKDGKPEIRSIILNGKELKEYDGGVSYVSFSPDSRRYAYYAREKGHAYIVLDGKENGIDDDMYVDFVNFTYDSSKIAYQTTKGKKHTGDDYVIFKKEKFGPFKCLGGEYLEPIVTRMSLEFVFSPNNKHIVYMTQEIADQDNYFYRLYLDGRQLGKYEDIRRHTIMFTHDSNILTYFYKTAGKWFFAFGEKKYGPYDDVRVSGRTFADDSKLYAFCARQDGKWFVITPTKEYGPFKETFGVLISSDGKRIVYFGEKEGKSSIYCNDDRLGAFSPGDWPYLDKDGNFLFTLREGSKRKVYSGEKKLHELTLTDPDSTVNILWYTKKTGDFVLIENEDEMTAVVNGRKDKTYPDISTIRIDKNSGNYAYWVLPPESEGTLVVNGVETLKCNRWGYPMAFGEDGRLYGALVWTEPHEEPSSDSDLSWWDKEVENMRLILFEVVIKTI